MAAPLGSNLLALGNPVQNPLGSVRLGAATQLGPAQAVAAQGAAPQPIMQPAAALGQPPVAQPPAAGQAQQPQKRTDNSGPGNAEDDDDKKTKGRGRGRGRGGEDDDDDDNQVAAGAQPAQAGQAARGGMMLSAMQIAQLQQILQQLQAAQQRQAAAPAMMAVALPTVPHHPPSPALYHRAESRLNPPPGVCKSQAGAGALQRLLPFHLFGSIPIELSWIENAS